MQSQNWTGLILSSRRGNLSIVKKLLDKGAGVNILTKVRLHTGGGCNLSMLKCMISTN